MTKIALKALNEFAFVSYDKIRYGDTDRQGHVNNAVFATFMETGRAEFILNPQRPMIEETAEIVLASLNINLIGEVHWPGEVKIGTAILKVGNSSITLYQQLFQNEICVAIAESVMVQIDSTTRRSKPLSDLTRERLGEYLLD